MKERNSWVPKLFRQKELEKIDKKITCLGKDTKFTTRTFCEIRFISTMLLFTIILFMPKNGYIYAPIIAIGYYYLFYYVFISSKIKKRIYKLDYEALQFFEILTLTLEI